MLDKAPILGKRPEHAAARQQLVVTQYLVELAIVARQREPQPGMDTATNFDDAANRLAPLQRSRKTENVTFAMSAGDLGHTHAANFHPEYFAQPGPRDPETAFAAFIDFHDGNAGQRAAQGTRVDIVSGDAALAITA